MNVPQLDATAWEHLVLDEYSEDVNAISTRLADGHVDALVEPLLAETERGWTVLETGSGWGSLSATLAINGRQVTLMDWSPKIAGIGRHLLRRCGIDPQSSICADLFAALPFGESTIDCVWSSGVLEHFSQAEQVRILVDSFRVARRKVISMVPNRLSIPYRYGKWHMERKGTWDFGYEKPERSQRTLFYKAGCQSVKETTADAERSGWFLKDLPHAPLLQRNWVRLCRKMPRVMNTSLRQGYMLVTIGDVE